MTLSSVRFSLSAHHCLFCGAAQSPIGEPDRMRGESGAKNDHSLSPSFIQGKFEKKSLVSGGAKHLHIRRRRRKSLGRVPVHSMTPRSKSARTPSKSQYTCHRVPGTSGLLKPLADSMLLGRRRLVSKEDRLACLLRSRLLQLCLVAEQLLRRLLLLHGVERLTK